MIIDAEELETFYTVETEDYSKLTVGRKSKAMAAQDKADLARVAELNRANQIRRTLFGQLPPNTLPGLLAHGADIMLDTAGNTAAHYVLAPSRFAKTPAQLAALQDFDILQDILSLCNADQKNNAGQAANSETFADADQLDIYNFVKASK